MSVSPPTSEELAFIQNAPFGKAAYEGYAGRKDWNKLTRAGKQIWINTALAAIGAYNDWVMGRT